MSVKKQRDTIFINIFSEEFSSIVDGHTRLHFWTCFLLAVTVCLSECAYLLFSFVYGTPKDVLTEKFFKLFLIPSITNFIIIQIAVILLIKVKSRWKRALIISIMYDLVVVVTYIVHSNIPATIALLAIPSIITIPYADIKLTFITSGIVHGLKILVDIFVQYDPTIPMKFSTSDGIVDFIISFLVLGEVNFICAIAINAECKKHAIVKKQKEENDTLYSVTLTDPLTQIKNRNGLRIIFDKIMSTEKHFSFVMIDLDLFKEKNDTYGHLVGDQYLMQFADVLRGMKNTHPFRFGGDEFCLIIENTESNEIKKLLQSAIDKFQESDVCKTHGIMTVSCGVAFRKTNIPASALIKFADEALYEAKKSRNSISFYSGDYICDDLQT